MQTLIALLVVGVAALYLAGRLWRAVRAGRARRAGRGDAAGCDAGCGCGPAPRSRPSALAEGRERQ